MAYRRPAVTVIQEFVGLQPALAAFALPSVVIGPSYQLVTDDNLGSYANAPVVLDYTSVPPAGLVDLAEPDPNEQFPVAQFNVSARLANAILEIVSSTTSNTAPTNSVTFVDSTLSTQFEDVVAGDKVVITSGLNAGTYVVRAKVSNTVLTLQTPLPDITDAAMVYSVDRAVANVPLVRDTDYVAEADDLSVNSPILSNGFTVLSGTVLASYRALRNDLASTVVEYADLTAVQNAFGLSQLSPANPLSYALQIALQNTVTPVNGLALSTEFAADEIIAYDDALDVIKITDMYMLCPLTQNAAVGPIFRSFVDGESAAQRERACVINRQLLTITTLQSSEATSTSTSGARTIVTTQTTGGVTSPDLSTLTSIALFTNVKRGDSVVITAGTGVTPGTYTVLTVTDSSDIILSSAFAVGTTSDVTYFIVRRDGISADGLNLYDRNATFLSNGVATGDFITVTAASSSFAIGRFEIANVISEHEVQLADPINGITSLVTAVVYDADRDMTKDEQASFLASFSTSIGDRRVVNMWPDQLIAPVANVLSVVPGFYGGAALAGITTGLPTQQGFTNLSISGFLGLNHSSGYFNDDQLDVIAGGGTMVLAQAGPQQPLFIRHQLTTDVSSIKFQEFSVTKNVDFVAKFIRKQYAGFVGPFNVINTTLDDLKTTAKGILTFLVEDSRLPKIGGILRSGSLAKLIEDPNNIDTVLLRFVFAIPIPLNHIDITIQV